MYNHLLYKGYDIKVGYYGDKEIDFIGEKNGEKLYIQVALKIDSDKTAEREFGNLLKIQDNYPKIVEQKIHSAETATRAYVIVPYASS